MCCLATSSRLPPPHHGAWLSPANKPKSALALFGLMEPGLNERLKVAVTGARRPTLVALFAGVNAKTWNGAGAATAVEPVVKFVSCV